MNDFLLELTVEEIPSRMQSAAICDFEKLMIAELERLRVSHRDVRSFISPRRMVFAAKLGAKTEEFVEEKKGPQVSAPLEVIEKFLKANNVSKENCIEKEVDKKIFLFIAIKRSAQNTSELLGEAIKNAVAKIPWKKSMRWGSRQFYFVRPLQNVMAIFNENLLDVNFNEIGLKSRDHTFGHRFLAPQKVAAKNSDEYLKKMREAFVIVDANERKQIILDEFKKIESQFGISIETDEKLLEEVVGLVEYPVVLLGRVPEKFMRLPEEAITTPMRVHQRYFPTRSNGAPAPYFAFVANNVAADDGKTIIAGNERVLNARLADALFFFETDLLQPLESRLEELKKIAFNDKLGTVYDRVQRVANVCDFVCDSLEIKEKASLKRAAILAKCDLSSGMVGEFAELQGIMGAHYAKIQGEDSDVCAAIRDQYRAADEITNRLSALFSLADKIEIITSFFAIGKEPTGSKDPFALRRAAIGILKIIKNFNLDFDLKEIVQKAFDQLPGTDLRSDAKDKVYDFILERLKVVLKESGIRHDVANAAAGDDDNILVVFHKAEVLNDFLQSKSGEKLSSLYKRVKNIIGSNDDANVDPTLFREKEEIVLFEKIEELEKDVAQISDFKEQLFACLKMEKSLSDFFDEVLVNENDEQIKRNRLNLLTKLSYIFDMTIPNGLEG